MRISNGVIPGDTVGRAWSFFSPENSDVSFAILYFLLDFPKLSVKPFSQDQTKELRIMYSGGAMLV